MSLIVASSARAHEDPSGCFETGPAIIVSVFRANGTTGVVGSVSECETINYRATLQKASNSDTICAFSGGTFKMTLPNGTVVDINLNVPCIGGTAGEGCDPTITQVQSSLIPYTVNPANIVNGFVVATASYTGGVAHDTPGNTPGVAANTPKSTPVVRCIDNDACTTDVCNPALQAAAACSFPPIVCVDNDPCTSDACVGGSCVFTPGALDCNDNDPCTSDACVTGVGCTNTPGALNCNDNDPCTSDACVAGVGCVNTPGALNCNDNDPCTNDACVTGVGCVNTPGALNCNDNDQCTSDACVTGVGCVNTPGALNCNDNDPCTSDACVAGVGCVNTPGALNCNDNNLCTTDSCVAGVGCVNQDISPTCDDNDPCTTDSCHPVLGCQNVPNQNPECLGLNHFQCYEIKPFQFPRRTVTVADRYGSATVTIRPPNNLCAPSDKRGEDPEAPTDPEHLTTFPIIGPAVRVNNVTVANQFGNVKLDLTRRAHLMVPTSKSLVSPPPPLASPIDHFQCYRVRRSIGSARFTVKRGIPVVDQFGSHAVDLLRPRFFCVPANKNNEDPGAINHTEDLLCYKTEHKARFTGREPFINHQFGPEDVKLIRRTSFCVPSSIVTD